MSDRDTPPSLPNPVPGPPARPLARRTVLAAVAVTAGTSPAVVGQEGDEEPSQEGEDGEPEDENGEGEPGGTETVELVDYAFEPGTDSPLSITPGTTVRFVWVTDQHNIALDSQPEESDWEGHDPIEDTGFEHEHTFEVEGDYEFHCTPHIGLGMVGTITVGEGGGEGGPIDLVPEEATALVVATVASLLAVLALSYAFLKYGGYSGD